jgi:hypothetical protein
VKDPAQELRSLFTRLVGSQGESRQSRQYACFSRIGKPLPRRRS